MSKFFYKGRITPKPKYQSSGFNTKRQNKLGSAEFPLELSVVNQQRELEINELLLANKLHANINVDANKDEDIKALTALLETPKTTQVEKVAKRNDPCPCNSGKKFKKCCGLN
ncbi:zinc chelation protein SecC [Alginatibacterium sediminis]|uniref:Zinc chelation protein SecC n=1 Tax=Alginatibacterium sediminis TaxID=2164068 RepID=A0A420EGB7_9ALTE|nr:PBPRA1643 family SWIM/SEC-C metal-binding motif protein [Alginatibacterium sediminis]RKF19752.1 zinc chelation protein SecC [Alginatibacterium sediminis]